MEYDDNTNLNELRAIARAKERILYAEKMRSKIEKKKQDEQLAQVDPVALFKKHFGDPHATRRGYVYVIGPKWWHTKKLIPVKIGKAENPEERLSSLQGGNWEELVIIRQSPAYINPLLIESQLHKQFDESRIHREWFLITQDELDTITELLVELKDH